MADAVAPSDAPSVTASAPPPSAPPPPAGAPPSPPTAATAPDAFAPATAPGTGAPDAERGATAPRAGASGPGKGFREGETEDERRERMRRIGARGNEAQGKRVPIIEPAVIREDAEPGREFRRRKHRAKEDESAPVERITLDAAKALVQAGTVALDALAYNGVKHAPRLQKIAEPRREEIARIAVLNDDERKQIVTAVSPLLAEYELPPWVQAALVVGMIYAAKFVVVSAAINAAEMPTVAGNGNK